MKDGSKQGTVTSRLRTGSARLIGFFTSQKTIWRCAIALCLGATIYWSVIASDRYVSEADILIEHTQLGSEKSVDISSLLTGGGSSNNRADQLLLRSYLLSADMMSKLDAKLGLKKHYSDSKRDPLSRLDSKPSREQFYRYYLTRVGVEYDDYSGVLQIRAQAFDPKTAQLITQTLLSEGEAYMNELGHRLAQSQVTFLEREVGTMAANVEKSRMALLAFQNKYGMASPENTAETDIGSINKLRANRVELETRRAALLAYLTPQAPGVVDLNVQISAIDQQIAEQQGRLTGQGTALNSTLEQYQRLQMTAMFAQDIYKTALVGLEKGRVEITRTLKKVSTLQAPTLPEEPVRPRRLYNIVTFILVTLLIAGIVNLLAAIVRDHKD